MAQNLKVIALITITVGLLASARPSAAQAYLSEFGSYPWTTPMPVAGGYIDAANGNLHIEIPIASIAERGHVPYVAKLVYDSHIWQQVTVGSSTSWQATNVPGSWGGWRLITSAGTGGGVSFTEYEQGVCEVVVDHQFEFTPYYGFKNWSYITEDGHSIPFGIGTGGEGDTCGSPSPSNNGTSTDASGYHLYLTNWTDAVVYAPDGTQVYPQVKDTNGNYYSAPNNNGDVTDPVGRQPITTSVSGNTITYKVLNSQGSSSPSTFVVTTESIPVSTAFGQSGVTECSSSCNITVISSITFPDNTTYQFSYDQGTGSGHYGVLTKMTMPSGGSASYGYANFKDAYGNQSDWVDSYSLNNGTWTFAPEAEVSCTSSCTQNCAGCTQLLTETGPSGEQSVYTFSLNTGAWETEATFYDTTANGGAILKQIFTNYNFSNLPYVLPENASTTLKVPGSTGYVEKEAKYTYDASNLGNILELDETNFFTGSPTYYRTVKFTYLSNSNNNMVNKKLTVGICPYGCSSYTTETQIAYDGTATSSVTGVVNHDDTNFGTSYSPRGNPTLTTQGTGGSTATTRMTYDMTGQVTSSTDNDANKTQFSYADSYFNDTSSGPASTSPPNGKTNAFVTQVTLPTTWNTGHGYYLGTGQVATTTDQNGYTTTNSYLDPFSRARFSQTPIGSSGSYSWQENTYTGQTEIDSYIGITAGSPTTSCGSSPYNQCRHDQTNLDAYGRATTQVLMTDPDGQTTTTTSYNSEGQISNLTNPERSSSDDTYGSDTYTYDGLGHVIKVAHSDGTSASTYYGAAVTNGGGISTQLCSTTTNGLGYPALFVDEAGKIRQVWSDAFGHTIEVDELNNTGTLTVGTCYTYDVLGNLTGVTQGSQTRSYTYDALSRVLTATTPESGHVAYNYVSSGGTPCSGNPSLACQRTDARGITTTYSYDSLNRLTGLSYSDTTPGVVYSYDSGTKQLGFRTGMNDASGNTTWTYNNLGWMLTEQRTIASKSHTISYTYDGDGTIASITYPSGNTITYTIGGAERAISAIDTANGLNYVKSASYAAPGELAATIFGQATAFNGINGQVSFNSRLELTGAKASTSSTTAQNLSFAYNNNGTVSSIQNGLNSGLNESFTYDPLNRILSAGTSATSGTGCWGESYGTSGAPPPGPPDDRWGNLMEMNPTYCAADNLSVGASSATNQLSATNISYDLAGNMAADGSSVNYSFDAANHLVMASGTGSGNWSYVYDANNFRVEKTNGTSGTLYWRDLAGDTIAETDTTGSTTNQNYREYVFFAGQRVAQRDATTPTPIVYFYFADQVGSITSISTATGSPCYEATFTPYGKEMPTQTTCSSNYKFTGYERDSETGLDYAFERYYNWRLGRFMSADPLGGEITDPQLLNRYAYVRNSPPEFNDPLGTILYPCAGEGCVSGDLSGSAYSGFIFLLESLDTSTLFDLGSDPGFAFGTNGNPSIGNICQDQQSTACVLGGPFDGSCQLDGADTSCGSSSIGGILSGMGVNTEGPAAACPYNNCILLNTAGYGLQNYVYNVNLSGSTPCTAQLCPSGGVAYSSMPIPQFPNKPLSQPLIYRPNLPKKLPKSNDASAIIPLDSLLSLWGFDW